VFKLNEESKLNKIRQELSALQQRRRELVEQSYQEQTVQEIPSDSMENNPGMANSQSKSMERGKVLTLSNGHSILGDNNRFNGWFINLLIISLLAGFASGAIATAIYIFINLGKVTINL